MNGALEGIRVVELGGIGPVPYAALVLAELGADVVRVDRAGEPNPLAASGGLRRSRPGIIADLKHPQGLATVLRLVDDADVLLEGWRPGVAERLGLGPEDCMARNPRLVHARMTGWGQDGPLATTAGHDITYAALSGSLHAFGPAERPIAPPPVLGDFGGGSMYLLVGILSALLARQRTGRGQVVDAAMVDGAASLLTVVHGLLGAGAWLDERAANLLDGGAPFYDVYACADGKFVAVGALEPPFFAALLAGLGVEVEGEQHDRGTWPAQRAAFTEAFASRTRDDWATIFEGTDACVAPVLSLTEAPEHPHLRARGTFAVVDGHPVPRTGPRLSATPMSDPGPERPPGADTTAYLTSHGFTAEEVAALLGSGAVVQT